MREKVRTLRPTPATVIAIIALVIAMGGVATATIPGRDGTIYACYTPDGDLRVIDNDAGASCASGRETALNWNKQGPRGPKGETGATGPQGPSGQQGPPGPAGMGFARMVTRTKAVRLKPNKRARVATMIVPAGFYAIDAKLTAVSAHYDGDYRYLAKCTLRAGKGDTDAATADMVTRLDGHDIATTTRPLRHSTLAMSVLEHFPNANNVVAVHCRFRGRDAAMRVKNVRIRAIELGGFVHDKK